MDDLIQAVLSYYVPILIITSSLAGIFAIAIAGSIRNSGKLNDLIRSNSIIQNTIIGLLMLFFSGAFVFAFHQTYVSRYYSGIESNLENQIAQLKSENTSILQSQVNQSAPSSNQQPQCILGVIGNIDCLKEVINETLGSLISVPIRALGSFLNNLISTLSPQFQFMFSLPTQMIFIDSSSGSIQIAEANNFSTLLKFTELVSLAFVYMLMVTHYFKSIIFSLDSEGQNDFILDIGKMILGFAGVFLAKYLAEAIIFTAQSFATFLFNSQLASGLLASLQALTNQNLWNGFNSFGLSLVLLSLFVLAYIILFGFVAFKNAKRYFVLLVMILLAPIFTPMLFFEETRSIGITFWIKFFSTSFGLTFDLIIMCMIFTFLGGDGLSMGNLLLILIGLAVVADSNSFIQKITNTSEVAGFKSVVSSAIGSGSRIYNKIKDFGS